MNNKLVLFLIGISLNLIAYSAENLLDRQISIHAEQVSVKSILRIIEQKGDVRFSYNPLLIDEDRVINLTLDNQPIKMGLKRIFSQDIRFKEVGGHIVLLANEDSKALKQRKREDEIVVFKGRITDKRTGLPVGSVSIYDIDARNATLSNQNGYYSLEINKLELIRSLYIRKEGYEVEVIVVSTGTQNVSHNNVELNPILKPVVKISPQEISKLKSPLEERALSGRMISEEAYLHGINLGEIEETRIAQVSLVPSLGIGSNLSTNSLFVNNFSLNILSGFSNGVYGAEVGGLLNLVRNDVYGFQVAGLSNIVGRNVEGAQFAGVYNLVLRNVKGAQVSGVYSHIRKNLTGVQISGVFGVVDGSFWGAQISGISNLTKDGFEGAQIAGIQLAGIANSSFDTLIGAQLSGIINFSYCGPNDLQISGIGNIADDNKKLQLTGIYNFARINNGVQIGLINQSYSGDGAAIGLFNYVKDGYHKTELLTNDATQAKLKFKTGTQRLYNVYSFGVRFATQPIYAVGFGFGTYFELSDRFTVSCDLTSELVFKENLNTLEVGQLASLSPTLDFRIANWVTIFAGPTFNFMYSNFTDEAGNYNAKITNNTLLSEQDANGEFLVWIGGQVGFRF